MDPKRLEAKLSTLKMPAYRLKQALRSYYQELAEDWSSVTTWPAQLRADCTAFSWSPLTIKTVLQTEDPPSAKFAFQTADNLTIETVVMRHADGRNTVCVSSQVGCAMGCAFCATGTMGIKRNLTAEEIVDQVVQAARWLKTQKTSIKSQVYQVSNQRPDRHDGPDRPEGRVTNIVFMGMGEPFNNPDAVFEAIGILTSPDMFGLGARHISVSTCGIVPGIERLSEEAPQVNLAISLHAPTQDVRASIMPVAKAYPLDRLMRAVRKYLELTHRKVMFEYVLLDGVNDSQEDAEDLADLFNDYRHLAHVNLINYHQTDTFKSTSEANAKKFQNVLRRRGISVTRRISFGEEIDAACGQLAARETE